MLPLENKNVKK